MIKIENVIIGCAIFLLIVIGFSIYIIEGYATETETINGKLMMKFCQDLGYDGYQNGILISGITRKNSYLLDEENFRCYRNDPINKNLEFSDEYNRVYLFGV